MPPTTPPNTPPMTYEQPLDEVATLLFELYDQTEDAAIKIVMAAQADDFFSPHDDDPSMCTLERAQADARSVMRKYGAGQRPTTTKVPPRPPRP